MKGESLREPFVLETVQAVEKTEVEEVEGGAYYFDRQQGDEAALDQKNDLDDNREHRVGDHHRYVHGGQRSAFGVSEC